MWKVYLTLFVITTIISYLWVRGINKMKNEHPDYKGEDFLKFNDDEKENKIHKRHSRKTRTSNQQKNG